MRNKTILLLLTLAVSCAYISCNDIFNEEQNLSRNEKHYGFSIEDAHAYFMENATDLQPLSIARKITTRNDGASFVELIPDWGNTTCEQNEVATIHLIPIRSITTAQIAASIYKNGKKSYEYYPAAERRLTIAQRNNGEIEMFLITIVPEIRDTRDDANDMMKNFRYLSGNSKFNGKVFLSTLEGHFIKAFGYTDGQNNGKLSTVIKGHKECDSDTCTHEHTHSNEHADEVLMRLSFRESKVIMTRAGGGEYYAGMDSVSDVICSLCQKPDSQCECEVVIIACRYCGEIDGCVCETCSKCGFREEECMCICETCGYNIKDCNCSKFETGDYENGSSGSGSGGTGNSSNTELAKEMFRNDNMTEEEWEKIEKLLEKIISTCMGGKPI